MTTDGEHCVAVSLSLVAPCQDGPTRSIIVVAMVSHLVLLVCVLAQTPDLPVELRRIHGPDTIEAHSTKLRLPRGTPSKAELLGEFDWDADGRPEIFAGWSEPAASCEHCEEFNNHILVLRPKPGGSTRLIQHITIRDEKLLRLCFYRPRDRRDTPKVVALVLGGATYSTVYLLRPGVTQGEQLFAPNDFEFADLNGDGVSEAIAWDRRPDDKRCHFGFMALRVNPQVYSASANRFHTAWPLEAAARTQVMAQFVGLDRQGSIAMIALEDDLRMEPGAQRLAMYRMEGDSFRLLSAIDAPWPRVAVLFTVDDRKQTLELRTASPESCAVGGDPESGTSTTSYTFSKGRLEVLRPTE